MRWYLLLGLCFFFVFNGYSQNYLFENGKIWAQETFVEKDFYVLDATFSFEKPTKIDSIIDLNGQFVIPPFGDFHTHLFDGDYSKVNDTTFLKAGIFYAQDLVNDPAGSKKMRPYFDQTKTVDVAYANGCLTSNYGHPIAGYERQALKLGWRLSPAQKKQLAESRTYQDRTYYIIDRPAEVQANMNKLIGTQPDVIKVILYNSQEYENSDTFPIYNLGLDPKVLPAIMKTAQESGKRVIAHVESEYDIRVAMKAGIQHFAHIPYYSYGNSGAVNDHPPVLSDSILKLMQQHKVAISPTLGRTFINLTYLPKQYQPDSMVLEAIKVFHANTLKQLKESQIQLLAGADMNGSNAVDEILYYNQLKVFTPKELLQMLIYSGKAIFPNRRIAAIQEQYEASFLVLGADPTMNIKNIKNINFRMKSGKFIDFK
ncbi:MAG: amidohydrolase family protein [Saprospiraceae bacterium]